ncbi:prepilin-type N-terminal cleavage/methylation domain-containing protein [bacterium]|nr:prepilin-type N-terminal cleavage/methylation domain-containing protein [bacterium]
MKISNSRGFSLVELLAVVGIFMVLATVSVVAWNSFGPVMALNGAAEGLGDSLELCMHKAIIQKNEFYVLINYRNRIYRTQDGTTFRFPPESYVLVDDDGWAPTNPGQIRQYNSHSMHSGDQPEFKAEWIPDSTNYASSWRNNNLLESRELFNGPVRLGKGIFFQSQSNVADAPTRVVFSYRQPRMYWHGQNIPVNRPIYDSERREDVAKIFLSNNLYDPSVSSHDNNTHLRVVRISENKVEVYRPV